MLYQLPFNSKQFERGNSLVISESPHQQNETYIVLTVGVTFSHVVESKYLPNSKSFLNNFSSRDFIERRKKLKKRPLGFTLPSY